ncbi:MAG: eukaryotic-like serine/threonine-protein kinase [Gaiellaceae bacterium]|nr:eukaryotic-like serine/threonine-protein kinase [Gaiellaceae bacterium]
MRMATDPLIDTLFDSRYKIVRKLGSGGMANVYLAEDQELGRRVAIKILDDRHAADEQFVERFRREAKNAAGLSQPNIVSIYDRGEAEGTYYIAMEYLDGRSLKELIVTRGPAPISIAIDYARQILAALRFAHRNGIVHRDIKPHNVLVDSDARVKVTDFGIARAGASQMTEAGSIIGTAQYLSPEQARGTQVDQTSDLYSLGIVLYELLTGTVPFTGDTPVEIAMKHLSATPEPPSAKRVDVPHALDMVVLRALAKDPADRYQSAEEMDADLERVARGLSVAPETEEAATTVLRGVDLAANAPTTIQRAPTAVTQLRPAPPPVTPAYYDYDEAPRRRAIWPWLLAFLLVAAAAVAGVYVYKQIQHELNANAPVGVPYVGGLRELNAVDTIHAQGLSIDPAHIHRIPDATTAIGYVIRQDPSQGSRTAKGNFVSIWVSTGKPKALVPDVRGKTQADAVAALVKLNLTPDVHQTPSDKPANTVTAQDPKPGVSVPEGSKVRINVSSGPKPVAVPSVIGQNYDSASSSLLGQGFAVKRIDQDNAAPANQVISQNPAANTSVPPGSTITLTVSRGPKAKPIPSVVNLDIDSARTTLTDAGFKVSVVYQDTTDQSLDGVVTLQDPPSGTAATPGTTVTITVGRYGAQPPPPTTTPTTPTP